ncbi:MAG: hypothetical protein GTN99_09265 [Candidatus Dadabacteria bacterium]|nr:hypothetical protein [Candidatus Dadabacteria bacterium]
MKIYSKFILKLGFVCSMLVGTAFFWLGCVGDNPPQAPFGSTVSIVNPPNDINIPQEAITLEVVEALVTGPDGQPLNDVLVEWRLFGTGVNQLLFDTDGDGVPDVGGLQMIDNEACGGPLKCSQIPIPELLGNPDFRDAFVDTPFITITNDFGVAEISILITGQVVFDPTTLEISLLNGETDSVQITLNAG